MPASPHQLLGLWQRLSGFPGGRAIFAFMLRLAVPYSATVGPRVLSLAPGHARVAIRDRRGVRNHLRSIHAIALANLGELTSGLALTTALPGNVRAIPVGIDIAYHKKARGTLIAESTCSPPNVSGDVECLVTAEIRDAAEAVVATVTARWRLGLAPAR